MSKYTHWWRPNVERALREYPRLKAKKNAMQECSITPNYSGLSGSTGPSRTTEQIALRQLPDEEEKWIVAIERATEEIAKQKDGADVLRIVEECYYRKSMTLAGVAMKYYMDERTALRRRNRFIVSVAKHMGYLKGEL
ncbi:MAG: hypothetical protein MJY95_08325 [Bacteroidaceae bacterium]|nr:hypothetical protein [Bacteroidaceae bacterium]